MTVIHRRSFGLLGGRMAVYMPYCREFLQYHKSNGVNYEAQIAFGGESNRLTLVARYESMAALETYYRKVMADPAFQAIATKSAEHVVTGSTRDDFWRLAIPAAHPGSGPLLHARVMGLMPGRLMAGAAIMKEFIDHFASIGSGYFAIAPMGMGDPMRMGLACRYPDAAALEAFNMKMSVDTKYWEIVSRNAVNLVPGSMLDEMWLTI